MESQEGILKTQATTLFGVADKAIQKVDETALALGTTREELLGALDTFKSEAKQVTQQIEKAGEKVTYAPVVRQIQTDNLLQEASSILAHLQEYSVDMAHLFTPKAEENLWERYYNGDKTVFMRHIKSELSASKYKKLKELYQSDPAFRESVDKYMEAFETMTQTLDKEDDSKLWMSIVIGSDVGRLYMVLADVLKGKNNAH